MQKSPLDSMLEILQQFLSPAPIEREVNLPGCDIHMDKDSLTFVNHLNVNHLKCE